MGNVREHYVIREIAKNLSRENFQVHGTAFLVTTPTSRVHSDNVTATPEVLRKTLKFYFF